MRVSWPVLLVLACVSAAATIVIIRTGQDRTSAQTAALATLAAQKQLLAQARTAPAAATVTAASSAPPVTAPATGGGGGGGSTGGGGGGSTGGGGGGSTGGGGGGAGGDTGGATTTTADASSTTSSSSTTTSSSSTTTSTGANPATDAGLPKVGHVFLIALSTPSYAAAFGHRSAAPYLRSLIARGTLLSGFRSLGHGELADELAMVSGQAPNRDTGRGCPRYSEYPSSANANAAGEVSGAGCVYPESALTIGDQVTSDGKVWGAYVADMGNTNCQHPNSNASADAGLPGTQSGYDLQHNPFVFFHSVLDDGDCQADDQDLSKLPHALASQDRTPRFTYLGADACADGDPVPAVGGGSAPTTSTTAGTTSTTAGTTSTTAGTTSTTTGSTTSTGTTSTGTTSTGTTGTGTTTTGATAPPAYGCPAGAQSGLPAEDAFLKQWVPAITGSRAYRKDGVLVIAFAGTRAPGHPLATGALVLSRYTPKGKRITTAYGPYALLRSLEDMLDDTPLAHAATATSFAKAVL